MQSARVGTSPLSQAGRTDEGNESSHQVKCRLPLISGTPVSSLWPPFRRTGGPSDVAATFWAKSGWHGREGEWLPPAQRYQTLPSVKGRLQHPRAPDYCSNQINIEVRILFLPRMLCR